MNRFTQKTRENIWCQFHSNPFEPGAPSAREVNPLVPATIKGSVISAETIFRNKKDSSCIYRRLCVDGKHDNSIHLDGCAAAPSSATAVRKRDTSQFSERNAHVKKRNHGFLFYTGGAERSV